MLDFKSSTAKVIKDKEIKNNNENAFKESFCLFQMEITKTGKRNKRNAQDCCDEIGKKYNASISARIVQHCLQHGLAGDSPLKQGPKGAFVLMILKFSP